MKLNEASLSFIELRHRQNCCPEPPPQAELRPRRLAATSRITTREARQKQNCCLGSFPQAELRPKRLATRGMAARWLGLFSSILLGHCGSVLLPPRIQQRSQVRVRCASLSCLQKLERSQKAAEVYVKNTCTHTPTHPHTHTHTHAHTRSHKHYSKASVPSPPQSHPKCTPPPRRASTRRWGLLKL